MEQTEQPQAGTQAVSQADATKTEQASDVQATTQTTTTPAVEANAKPEMTLEDAMRELREARKEAAKYRTEKKTVEQAQAEAQRKQDEERGEFKKLYEAAKAELEAARVAAKTAEAKALRLKVGGEFGLPEVLSARLVGETEEEMRADAEAVKSALPKPQPPTFSNDAGNGKGGGQALSSIGGKSPEQFAATYGLNPQHVPKQ